MLFKKTGVSLYGRKSLTLNNSDEKVGLGTTLTNSLHPETGASACVNECGIWEPFLTHEVKTFVKLHMLKCPPPPGVAADNITKVCNAI